MTKILVASTRLAVQRLLGGDELARHLDHAIELITTDPDGRAHVAMLSVGEALVLGPTQWRLGLHGSSSTAARLAEPGAEALCTVVADGALHGHRLVVGRSWEFAVAGQRLRGIAATVREVSIDEADYATLTGGPTFELTVPTGPVLQRWADTLSALRLG
ncbi:hypothetical protein [Nocardioides humi]|uniref:Uncharacterized protein n=1 Tax=Nocardioides humi TaxID=449461 RepID=A0ABN2A7L5_9ACTN|nr:hypothetical protein [Nocardioides humi]